MDDENAYVQLALGFTG